MELELLRKFFNRTFPFSQEGYCRYCGHASHHQDLIRHREDCLYVHVEEFLDDARP